MSSNDSPLEMILMVIDAWEINVGGDIVKTILTYITFFEKKVYFIIN